MPYAESDCLMLSALQHYAFCPRQCAFIHKDQLWADNYLTAKGDLFHQRVDTYKPERRKNFHTEFSVPIRSLSLGISGRTDIVEIYYEKGLISRIIPVEYKSGKKKQDRIDEVQICAQAICLEEMTSVEIHNGSIYYGREKRRVVIEFTDELRDYTEDIASKLHQMMDSEILPPPINSPKCKSCSFLDSCQPKMILKGKRAGRYIDNYLMSQDET